MTEIYPHPMPAVLEEGLPRTRSGIRSTWFDYGVVDEHDRMLPPGELGRARRTGRCIPTRWRASTTRSRRRRVDGVPQLHVPHRRPRLRTTRRAACTTPGRRRTGSAAAARTCRPPELEFVALGHPDVLEAAAFGVPGRARRARDQARRGAPRGRARPRRATTPGSWSACRATWSRATSSCARRSRRRPSERDREVQAGRGVARPPGGRGLPAGAALTCGRSCSSTWTASCCRSRRAGRRATRPRAPVRIPSGSRRCCATACPGCSPSTTCAGSRRGTTTRTPRSRRCSGCRRCRSSSCPAIGASWPPCRRRRRPGAPCRVGRGPPRARGVGLGPGARRADAPRGARPAARPRRARPGPAHALRGGPGRARRRRGRSPGMIVVDLQHLGRPRVAAAFLLEHPEPMLVDCGATASLPALRRALAARGVAVADLRHLLLTHVHLDHAGAAGTLVAENPALQVHVSAAGAPHLVAPERLERSARQVFGAAFDRSCGAIAPVPSANVRIAGDRAAGLAAFPTPGHAVHHVSYLDDAGTCFAGDVAGIRLPPAPYLIPGTPPPDVDLDAYASSLRRSAGPPPRTARAVALRRGGRRRAASRHDALAARRLGRGRPRGHDRGRVRRRRGAPRWPRSTPATPRRSRPPIRSRSRTPACAATGAAAAWSRPPADRPGAVSPRLRRRRCARTARRRRRRTRTRPAARRAGRRRARPPGPRGPARRRPARRR